MILYEPLGISRQAYYSWYRRCQAEGIEELRTRSRAPKRGPNATRVEVVGKIIYPRQNYHFGPEKIAMYLKRYHEVTISKSGVWRILKRLDMGRLPTSQRYKRHDRRWKRYEKQLPGHPGADRREVHRTEPLASMPQGPSGDRNKYYQFTAIDDCTRLRVLKIHPTLNQSTAIQFVDYVLQRLPFQVEVIQTDNGAEFQSAFHFHVLDKGIGHAYIKPRTPRLNGKVEGSRRIDGEEFYRLLELQSDFAILSLSLLGTGPAAGSLHPLGKTIGRCAVSGPCGDLLPVDRFALARSRRPDPPAGAGPPA
ncbi:helix-turn-helix domain-containing protein [Streptomyces sp. NPDC002701]|uniref:helix-turn-helix domain-containing protein n=1 Tax=Streptomyces sp. NPDC002701 TaxID=3364661 RepID=UPI0036C45382